MCTCSLRQNNETLTIFVSKSKPFQLLTRLPSRITIVLFFPPLIYSFRAINLSKHIRAWLDRESFVTFFGLPYEIFGLVNCKKVHNYCQETPYNTSSHEDRLQEILPFFKYLKHKITTRSSIKISNDFDSTQKHLEPPKLEKREIQKCQKA